MQRVSGLVWPVILSIALPLAAAWLAYPEAHLPPGFGVFPPLCGQPSRFQPGHLCCAGVGGSRFLSIYTVPSMVRLYDTGSAAQACLGKFPGVVLDRLGSDAVFLVADVGADHTFRRLGVLRLHALVVGLHSGIGRAGISP